MMPRSLAGTGGPVLGLLFVTITFAALVGASFFLPGNLELIVTNSRPSTGPPTPASERGIMRRPRHPSRPASAGAHPIRRQGEARQGGRGA